MSVKGEKYASKKAMVKHEKTEGKKERFMEYGGLQKGAKGAAVKKTVMKKASVVKKGK